MMQSTHIEAGKYIILRLPSENIKVTKLTEGGTCSLGKFGTFNVNSILGRPFGHKYEIRQGGEAEILRESDIEGSAGDGDDEESEERDSEQDLQQDQDQNNTNAKFTENNQQLFDDPSVQSLSMADIEKLKKEGISGQEIIEKVKQSHGSFNKKTKYSQEKYVKRKQQKFLQRFTPQAITANELIDIYTEKDALRIQNMSMECLGFMMSVANVQPGGKYLVVDDICGVLVASVLERMGFQGTVVVAHENEHPNLDGLRFLNLSEEQISNTVKSINWLDFFHPDESEVGHDQFQPKTEKQISQLRANQRTQYFRKKQRHEDFVKVREIIDSGDFDAILVASELHLASLMPRLIPVVKGSRPIVVYSEHKEALIETTNVFQKDLRIIGPTIMETRVRKYQTIPGRIHPYMTSRGSGGYVLSGLKVIPGEVVAATAHRAKKRKKEETNEKGGNQDQEMKD